jgi:hypothetical protein
MGVWWSWVPGLRGVALNKCRREALSDITGERLFVERMAQRPRPPGENVDAKRDEILNKLDEILAAAAKTNDIDELDDLTADAELQGLFAAYLCPVAEIKMEGDLVLDQIDGWGIPNSSTATARRIWQEVSQNLKTPPTDETQIQQARGALYALFAERDAWGDFLDDHDEETPPMWLLFLVVIGSLVAAVFAVYYAHSFSFLLMLGILAAGAAGSCASVMSKRATIEDRLSRKIDVSGGRVWVRIATGLIGTVIGCALLAWIPLSIATKSFEELVNACTTAPCTAPDANACTTVKMLIIIGISTLLGFSERTLPFFEHRLFGKAEAGLPPSSNRRKVKV